MFNEDRDSAIFMSLLQVQTHRDIPTGLWTTVPPIWHKGCHHLHHQQEKTIFRSEGTSTLASRSDLLEILYYTHWKHKYLK